MVKKPNAFLAAMKASSPEPEVEAVAMPVLGVPSASKPTARAGQKHLGAYFDKTDPILERVALLRARLDMNNSELIEYALNELWKANEAKRAFGD